MKKRVYTDGDEGVVMIVKGKKATKPEPEDPVRQPVHVVYGGADRFTAETPAKLGRLALTALETYAPDPVSFATALGFAEFENPKLSIPQIRNFTTLFEASPSDALGKDRKMWLAWTIYTKTIEKLRQEPVEDLRIDFEDGYGFRNDEEEDSDAERAASELARSHKVGTITPFCGFRIKSFEPETYGRAVRTLEIFLDSLWKTGKEIPENFVVTLPKVTRRDEVKDICGRLRRFEKDKRLRTGTIGLELMIETPEAVIDAKGRFASRSLVEAARGRVTSVHFGAYDYTSALGISAKHQDIRHPACVLARQIMLSMLAPIGVRLSDSVTTELPVPIHRGEKLAGVQKNENRAAVHSGWKAHFRNVSDSMANGFYQSWDLHPNQLPARYAAVYFFYLDALTESAERLKGFAEKATRAQLTGNTFDDAASVKGILNYFRRGIDCGALETREVIELTGVASDAIRSGQISGLAKKGRIKMTP
jgi:citrate lyase beta subunit